MGVASLIITEDGFSVFYRRWGYYHLYHVSTKASNSSSVRQPSPFSASSVAFKARCTASSTVYWHGIGVTLSFHPILRESSRSIAKSVLGSESVTFSMLVVVIVLSLSFLCLQLHWYRLSGLASANIAKFFFSFCLSFFNLLILLYFRIKIVVSGLQRYGFF